MTKEPNAFPDKSYPWYKWGIQGLVLRHVASMHRYFSNMRRRDNTSVYDDDSSVLSSANEKIEQWQFTCQ